MLRAEIGRDGVLLTTKAYLARKLGRHPRTIVRRLAALVRLGYATVERRTNAIGADIGLLVRATELLLPHYLVEAKGGDKAAAHKELP